MELFNNKRGSTLDLFVILLLLLGGSIVFVVGYDMSSEVFGELKPMVADSPTANESITRAEESLETFDYVFVAIFMGLIIWLIISAFLIDVNPVFTFIAIITLILAVVVAIPISNAYQILLATLQHESAFPMTNFIMSNLPVLTALLGTIAIVVVYGGKRLLGGGDL